MYACIYLGMYGNSYAVQPLINILNNNPSKGIKNVAIWALGEICDYSVIDILINELREETHPLLKETIPFALMNFERKDVVDALDMVKKSNSSAAIALAFHRGGKYLDYCNEIEIDSYTQECMFALAQSCWGNTSCLDNVFDKLHDLLTYHNRACIKLISIMPKDFPEYKIRDTFAIREKKAYAMKKWYDKNKHRLAWNAETRKYYLKPEKNPDKPKFGQSN